MPHSLGPTQSNELAALGAFLARGFRVAADHPFAATDVLTWKYGGARGSPFHSLVARDEIGAIVGHVGYALTTLRIAPDTSGPVDSYPILHMLDWLAAAGHPGVGTELARAVHEKTGLAYGLGGTPASRRAVRRLDYVLRGELAIHRRVLRPVAALHGEEAIGVRLARAARDAARGLVDRPIRPRAAVEALAIDRFGDEVERLVDASLRGRPLAATARTADLLNHRLAYPRGGLSGWHLMRRGESSPIGLAILAVSSAPVRTGTLVDLVLSEWDVDLAHAAIVALTEELRRLGAHAARVCASPTLLEESMRAAGYRPAHTIPWYVRDSIGAWPAGIPCWLTFHEADYAVLPV